MRRKIYCCDRGDNDNALTAAILANGRNNDFGMNGWMNNPFAYLMFLALFRNGGFDFDGNGAAATTQGIETQAQLNAIRTQLQDNQNANCIKSAIQGNGFALSQLAQTLPTSVTINQLGMTQGLIKIVCGKSNCYAINSSLSVSIPAEPAA